MSLMLLIKNNPLIIFLSVGIIFSVAILTPVVGGADESNGHYYYRI